MKILFFTKYSRLGASSRLRTFQYLPYYQSMGVTFKVCSLFDDNYLRQIYAKKKVSLLQVLIYYINRLVQLLGVWRYDEVVIEKELFPYLPAVAEKVLALLGVKYIVDYDDAIFHNYNASPNIIIRFLLKNKIAHVMKHATLVVTGNAYLRDYAKKAGAQNVKVIPTVIDIDKYYVDSDKGGKDVLTIGWIGSPSTLQYLHLIKPVLEEISSLYPIKLMIVGGKEGLNFKGHEEVVEWSEDKEISLIQQFDIGVMPLKDDVWELGKCGYKLIQYMGCGIPVIGSPIGANNEIIDEGNNGFKPAQLNEWKAAFLKLLEDKALRIKMGRNGRALVEKKYSLQTAQNQWLIYLEKVAATKKRI